MDERVAGALAWLERRGSKRVREEMLTHYGIAAAKTFGVGMADLQRLARELGRDHALAAALWETGWYEARMLTAFVDEPALVTAAQMDRWARDFDNWGTVDTLAFHLFDRTPHAWGRIDRWSRSRDEFVKRAAFALLACVALHDRTAPDQPFVRALSVVARGATDDRNFVKKAVSWSLHAIGCRNPALHAAATDLAHRLAQSDGAAERWVGRDATRKLATAATKRRAAAGGGAKRW